jgi:hypothetical protein
MLASTRASAHRILPGFQPSSLFKSQPITAMLSESARLNLYKARSPDRSCFPSNAEDETGSLPSRQSALLVLPDNSCLLLRAETPTRPPRLSILELCASSSAKGDWVRAEKRVRLVHKRRRRLRQPEPRRGESSGAGAKPEQPVCEEAVAFTFRPPPRVEVVCAARAAFPC